MSCFDALDGLFGHQLLDTHIQFGSEADAGAVDLTQDVGVLTGFIIVGQHEVSGPDEWDVVSTELFGDDWASLGEHVDEILPLLWLVVGVLRTGEQGGGECVATFSRLLVNNEDWVWADEEDADLTFHNAGHEAHVHEHAVVADDVLIAEVHEIAEFADLRVIIHSFRALKLGVQWQSGAWFDGLGKLLVLQLDTPDAGTGRTAVLFEDTLAVGKGGREGLMKRLHVVVSGGVFWHQVGGVELDQGILGAIADHLRWGGHTDKAGFAELGQHFEVGLFATWDVAWVYAGDVAVVVFADLVEDFIDFPCVEVDHLSTPALVANRVDDGHGVSAVPILALVISATDFEDNNVLVHENAPFSYF